ncbi:acyl-CoA dehydrogenase family protein [Azohydromonas lata]|uniref:acyl-CoA dehydrogenase family protein n=1 Tax=Azohydromonas lata TaxID=45677 RepID=UPI000834B663|nr:acyl-CoA dehydrogenase family protein [Azohydromonas lata]
MRELFESTMERLLADHVTPVLVNSCEAGQWPQALWSLLEESGFAVAAAPEALGGAGASWEDLYPVVRACGRHTLPLPLPETLLANALLGHCGLEARNEPLGIAARSTLKLEGSRVSGTLHDVPWGRNVHHAVAIVGDADPVLVVLPRSRATCTERANVAGEPRDELHFDAVAPVASAGLPQGLSGEALWLGGAMLRSAQAAGALEAILQMSTTYAGERVQFGKPLASFQAIQHQLAVMAQHTGCVAVAAEAAFAEAGNSTELNAWAIAAAKVCAAEGTGVAAGMAHAVHGAIGFTHEHALQQATRRLWAWRSEFGNLSHWAQRLGRAVCAGGSTSLWPAITANRLDLALGEIA